METEVHEGFSFSIREYVSRMRTVKLVESWPFDETRSEESPESLLPPMTVQRFIWWADGLKVLSSKSNNSSKKKKKKENNVGEDTRVAKVKPSRRKAKAPKKKSILEIFAVAATAKEEAPTTKNNKTNKSKYAACTMKKTKNKVIQKNKKKRNLPYTDNCLAFKRQQDKGEELGTILPYAKENGHSISKEKPGLQNLARNVNAKRGILGKDAKQFSPKQYKKSIMQEAVHLNDGEELKEERNVSSVMKDNKAREARKRLRPAECLNLQKFTCSDMDNKHDAGYVGTESNNVEAIRSRELQQNEEVTFCRSLTLDTALRGNDQDLLELGLRQVAIDGNAGGPLSSSCSQNFEVVMNSSGTPHLGFPSLAPMEYLQTVCSLPECHHEGHSHQLTMYGPREKILGLPVNSKGEFITSNSSPKGDLNQIYKTSAYAKASISLSPPSTKTFLAEGYLEEDTLAFAPSRLDVTDTDSQDNCLPFQEVTPLYKDYNLFQKCPVSEKNMSKLRLMGKEFVIGEGLQDFEIGHRWKDKQVVDEVHFSGSSTSNVMMPDQNEVCIEKLTGSYQTGSMHSFPHFDYSTIPMHQSNGFNAREFSVVEKTESEFIPNSYNYDPRFPEPFPVEYRYQFHQGSRPTMNPTDYQLKHRQNLSHAPSSAIRFPFMPPELDGHYQSSLSWRSDMSNLQSIHALNRCHHPYVMPGVNHWTYPIMYREPEPYCSYGPALFPPTLLAHQAPWMFYP